MLSRGEGEFNVLNTTFFPPIKFLDLLTARVQHPLLHARWNEPRASELSFNLLYAAVVEVIVVIVADHYCVYVRQLVNSARWVTIPLGPDTLVGCAPLAENGVCEQINAVDVNEHRRMPYPRTLDCLGSWFPQQLEIRFLDR